MFLVFLRILVKLLYFGVVSLRFLDLVWRITDKVRSYVSFGVSFCFVSFLTVVSFFLLELSEAGTGWFIFPVQRVSYGDSSNKNLEVSAG